MATTRSSGTPDIRDLVDQIQGDQDSPIADAILVLKAEARRDAPSRELRHNVPMTSPSREELDAKFERTEARVDARLAEFQRTTTEAMSEIKGELKAIHTDLGNLRSLKWQIWSSMAAAVALVFAIVTYGASTFESGRNTAVVVQDAQQKIDQAAAAMKKQQEDTQKLLQEAIKAISQNQQQKQ